MNRVVTTCSRPIITHKDTLSYRYIHTMGTSHSSIITPTTPTKFIIGIIDMQNDFCKGGALKVDGAEAALAAINKLRFIYAGLIKVFLSQDWHHVKHMSFAETHKKTPFTGPEKLTLVMEDNSTLNVEQMMWPRHCVENTRGARLHPDLIVSTEDFIIRKGTKQNVESYSAFGDEFHGKYEQTALHSFLSRYSITDIILTGLASDYCVYNTALDAVRLGYKVHLILSCTRGVAQDTTKTAFNDLKDKGVEFYHTVDEFYTIHKSMILPSVRY